MGKSRQGREYQDRLEEIAKQFGAADIWRRFDHGVQAHGTMMAVAAHPRDPAKVYCVSLCVIWHNGND
jgi:hypothetical protein